MMLIATLEKLLGHVCMVGLKILVQNINYKLLLKIEGLNWLAELALVI